MSWSVNYTNLVRADEVEADLDLEQATCSPHQAEWGPRVREQVGAAIAAAAAIIHSGTVGEENRTFRVFLSGYAALPHQDRSYADDTINVGVSQAIAVAPEVTVEDTPAGEVTDEAAGTEEA